MKISPKTQLDGEDRKILDFFPLIFIFILNIFNETVEKNVDAR